MVGTLGQRDVATGMALATATVGKYLSTIPDGEPGDRADWVTRYVEDLGNQPGVKTLKRSAFDKVPMRPWHGAIYSGQITEDTLALPYARHAAAAVPVLRDLIHASGYFHRLQVDIPGPLDLGLFCHGPLIYRYYETHVAAAARQTDAIEALTGTRPVYQLSIPLETYAVAMAPSALRPTVATALAARLSAFIQHTQPGTEWIVHLCVGDPHGKPLVTLKDTAPLVELANAIWREWPAGYRLNALHLPLGDGTHPAPADPAYYDSLRRLVLPIEVHISAGLAHLGSELADQQTALDEAERAAGRVLGVSTPCGLGRRPWMAEGLLRRAAELAES